MWDTAPSFYEVRRFQIFAVKYTLSIHLSGICQSSHVQPYKSGRYKKQQVSRRPLGIPYSGSVYLPVRMPDWSIGQSLNTYPEIEARECTERDRRSSHYRFTSIASNQMTHQPINPSEQPHPVPTKGKEKVSVTTVAKQGVVVSKVNLPQSHKTCNVQSPMSNFFHPSISLSSFHPIFSLTSLSHSISHT